MQSRVRFAMRGLVLGVLVAVPVSADQEPGAPNGQYENFTGDDRRIRDKKTGLRWERSVSASPVDFETAKSMCTGGLRLPTLKELLTLVDEQPHPAYDLKKNANVLKYIDREAFGAETPIDRAYWTSSMDGTSKAWTVDFGSGETVATPTVDGRYVRCVRFQ
ncbi:MAG: hypothetical protein BGO98_21670 [Myxococcales bacterium 68-20]|nr:DUF1566 domain-containing protein [Myxococcales bacterium]OJY28157.1 MAG: hypothetical protein BGO98_21670 [Myxococcales bacterium 68-20]